MDDLQAAIGRTWRELYPDRDNGPVDVVWTLKHAHAMLTSLVAPVFETAPVSESEFDVLLHLRYQDEPTIARRLAARLGRSPAALSKSLAKLEARKLVTRTVSPNDRRATLVRITKAGIAAVDEVLPRRLAVEGLMSDALKPAQRERIVSALTLLARTIEAAADQNS